MRDQTRQRLREKLLRDASAVAKACVIGGVKPIDPACCVWCRSACSMMDAADALSEASDTVAAAPQPTVIAYSVPKEWIRGGMRIVGAKRTWEQDVDGVPSVCFELERIPPNQVLFESKGHAPKRTEP